jgi:hypothetical protein
VYFACHAEAREGGCVSWANLVLRQMEGGAPRRHRVEKAARRSGLADEFFFDCEKKNQKK